MSAVTARLPLASGFDIAAFCERPVSTRKDIAAQRVTPNVAWEF